MGFESDLLGMRRPADELAAEIDPTLRLTLAGGEVSGSATVMRFAGGLKLTHAALAPHDDLAARYEAAPGLQAGIMLSGRAATGAERADRPIIHGDMLLTTVGAPVEWRTAVPAGEALGMLHVVADRDWLEASELSARSLSADRLDTAVRCRRAGRRVIERAERIRALIVRRDALARLRLEAAALDLMADVIAAFEESSDGDQATRRGAARLRRIDEVLAALAAEPGAAWSLDAIAREVGVSASVLCRTYKAGRGATICSAFSRMKLDGARRLLLDEGASIAHAAHWAGYGSQANFTTAYRRRFGETPGRRGAG